MKVRYFCFNANRFKFLVDKPSKPKQSKRTSAESGAMPQQSQIFTALYKLTEELFHRRIVVSCFVVAIGGSSIAYFSRTSTDHIVVVKINELINGVYSFHTF